MRKAKVDKSNYFVYEIKNITNNKVYIGITKNIKQRKMSHFSGLSNNSHYNSHLQNSYNKYGEQNFIFSVLYKKITKNLAILLERKLIRETDNYNITDGGEYGYKISNPEKISYRAKSCEWNGVIYSSIKECSIENNVNYRTMRDRISNGYVCDEDIKNRGDHNKTSCEWNGVKYDSVKECSVANGVEYRTMWKRIKSGHKCDSDMFKRK